MTAPEPLRTPIETAAYLKVPVKTLERWRYAGDGPRFYRVGRHARYKVADLDAYLESVASA